MSLSVINIGSKDHLKTFNVLMITLNLRPNKSPIKFPASQRASTSWTCPSARLSIENQAMIGCDSKFTCINVVLNAAGSLLSYTTIGADFLVIPMSSVSPGMRFVQPAETAKLQ